jgi:hypothetical protein
MAKNMDNSSSEKNPFRHKFCLTKGTCSGKRRHTIALIISYTTTNTLNTHQGHLHKGFPQREMAITISQSLCGPKKKHLCPQFGINILLLTYSNLY